MEQKILAKSNGTLLLEHSKSVTFAGIALCNILNKSNSYVNSTIRKKAILACALHDIGKCDESFQRYIAKGVESEAFVPHNVISFSIISSLLSLKTDETHSIYHGVSYHHGVIDTLCNNQSIYDELSDETKDNAMRFLSEIIPFINNTVETPIVSISQSNNIVSFPEFFLFNDKRNLNEMATIIRSIVIYADRLASSLNHTNTSVELFEDLITERNFLGYNHKLSPPSYFDMGRFNEQVRIATESINNVKSTTIIKAPAGFGKTITGLLYLTGISKRCQWVCPNNTIAVSTYESIVDELSVFNCDITVSLLISNKFTHQNFKGKGSDANIIVTNIDNYLRPVVKNDSAGRMLDMLFSTVIFDEFHDLDCNSAFFAGFINIMRCRNNYLCVKTLLLSATPEKFNFLWENDSTLSHIIKALPLNNTNGKFKFNVCSDSISLSDTPDSLTIVNSIQESQDLWKSNNSHKLFHSMFTDSDKEEIRVFIKDKHNKRIRKKDLKHSEKYNVVSTRILGTGLDISFGNLKEELLSPEATLQAIGRINRYSEIDKTIPVFLHRNRGSRSNANAINLNYSTKLTDLWYDWAIKHLDGKELTLSELYNVYDELYMDSVFIDMYNGLLKDKLNESKKHFTKLIPLRCNSLPNDTSSSDRISDSVTLRSSEDQRYVTALHDSGEIIDPITMNKVIVDRCEDKNDYTNDRIKAIKTNMLNDNRFKFSKYTIRNRNNITYNKLINYAKSKDMPFMLVGFKYNKNLGLYKV